jgi:hypothetical protein
VQVGQKQAVAAKKGLVVTVCVWAAYGECHAATAMVINCQLGHNQTAAAVHERPFIEAELSFGAAGRGHACRECRPKR